MEEHIAVVYFIPLPNRERLRSASPATPNFGLVFVALTGSGALGAEGQTLRMQRRGLGGASLTWGETFSVVRPLLARAVSKPAGPHYSDVPRITSSVSFRFFP